MTRPAGKPAADAPAGDLMLIVGQLLEATKAASDGLKSMSTEVQGNAKAIIATVKTLEAVEEKVSELDAIVRDPINAANLIAAAQAHASELAALGRSVDELKKLANGLRDDVGKLGTNQATNQAKITSHREIAWTVVKVAAWAITTVVAAWAAYSQRN